MDMTIKTIRRIKGLRTQISKWREHGDKIALVPTMGGLHEGHLSLVRKAQKSGDRVVVSLFVNPTQFNNKVDLKKYPRNEKGDLAALADLGVDLLYAPDAEEMYPRGFNTEVIVRTGTDIMDGKFRPGHFEGVATVVTKLFLQVTPDFACFGEKDFQQLSLIRKMVRDLDIPVKIIGVPTVRELDGLAMSSRNVRLSKSNRSIAPTLHSELKSAKEAILDGGNPTAICKRAQSNLLKAGFKSIDYFEFRSADELKLIKSPDQSSRLFVAARLGDIRLIDNLKVR